MGLDVLADTPTFAILCDLNRVIGSSEALPFQRPGRAGRQRALLSRECHRSETGKDEVQMSDPHWHLPFKRAAGIVLGQIGADLMDRMERDYLPSNPSL